jgi:hypothetical protein
MNLLRCKVIIDFVFEKLVFSEHFSCILREKKTDQKQIIYNLEITSEK